MDEEQVLSGDEADEGSGGQVVYDGITLLQQAVAAVDLRTTEEPEESPVLSRQPGARGGKNNATWLPKGQECNIDKSALFDGESGPILYPAVQVVEPLDAFDLFFPQREVITDALLKPTNRRAHSELAGNNPPTLLVNWKDVTVSEMCSFLAILFHMSLVDLPAERDYWSSGFLGQLLVQNLMRRDRFWAIKHVLSVANPTAAENTVDKLAKTRVWLDLVRAISQKHWVLGGDCGLDESQCLCGHRMARFSHRGETKKPMADYVKVIALHESKTGYCYAFVVDTRDQTTLELVLCVIDQLPLGARRIACDRFYTTVDNVVAVYRRGHFVYGTIRSDRGPSKTDIPGWQKVAPLQDGEYYWQMASEPVPMTMYLWRDSLKEGSWFLSTCHGSERGSVTRRKRGAPSAEKEAPQAAADYNANMGACDQCNSLRASYTCQLTHQRRWYMCLVYYGLDILMVNSYIYFKAVSGRSRLSQKEYRCRVVEGLLARISARVWTRGNRDAAVSRRPKRQRCPQGADPEELDHRYPGRHINVAHMPVCFAVDSEQQGRNCKLCYSKDKSENRTLWGCKDCDVYLCMSRKRNCFAEWHSLE